MKPPLSRIAYLCVTVMLATVLSLSQVGCSRVTLISPYDEVMDQSATALQKRMDAFLTMLEENPGAPQASYDSNKTFYTNYAVELRSVKIRAQSWPKNSITVRQIDLMSASLEELRKAHEDAPIQAAAVPAFRDLFNQGWRAILALEIAKKRGQSPPSE